MTCNLDSVGITGLRFITPPPPPSPNTLLNPGLEKSLIKLNLCQPVAFINLSRFKLAYINKSRLKFRINERTIQVKSNTILLSLNRLPIELAEREICPHIYWQAASSGSSSYEATKGGLYLAFGENKHILFLKL